MHFKKHGQKFNYAPQIQKDFHCTDTHETNTQQVFIRTSCTKFYPNRINMQKMEAKFTLSPPVKHWVQFIHFHGPQVCPTASRDRLYQMPPKHVNKCGKYGYTLIYTLM